MDIIEYPKKESEAEIQARLWLMLKNKGIDARLQVTGRINGRHPKLDIVVFRNKIPQAIIECKSWAGKSHMRSLYKKGLYNTKQIRNYNNFGLPVFICGGPDFIQETIELVLESYQSKQYEHVFNSREGNDNA